MNTFEDIIEKLSLLVSPNKTIVVGIDGRGGSGKSTLADRIQQKIPNSTIVHLDDIVYPMGGADRHRLIAQVLTPIKNSQQGRYQTYDYSEKKFTDWKVVNPEEVVIVEGVSTLHDDTYKFFDLKIWVECPAEIGLKRGVARELAQRGVDTSKEWREKWLPEEEEYITEQNPQQKADFIIFSGF